MYKLATVSIIIILAFLSACKQRAQQAKETVPDTTAVPGKSKSAAPVSAAPIQIDSSEYFMYPLPNGHEQNDDSGSGSFLSKENPTITYWNIAFYNTITKKIHLLDANRKMIINSYNESYTRYEYSSSDAEPRQGHVDASQKDGHIFYSIIAEDYNKDGTLDNKDPAYLFMSDNEGNNFLQISPTGTNVKSWELVKASGVVLMQTQRDSTYKGNKVELAEVPYAYDLKKGGVPEPVFNGEFSQMVNHLYKKQWPVKKKR